MDHMIATLREDQQELIRETQPQAMAELDEDDLIRLHSRVRRARKKYQKNYRRQASAGVLEHGGRGAARPTNTRAAQKAEIFEDALARVSGRLEVVARQAADELKAERLAAVGAARGTGPAGPAPGPDLLGPGTAREHRQTSGGIKRDASSQAAGARRQARKDGR